MLYHLPKNYYRVDYLYSCSKYEGYEGTDCCGEGACNILPLYKQFAKEGSKEAAQHHTYRGEDYANQQSGKGSSLSTPVTAGEFCKIPWQKVVHYCYDRCQHKPDNERSCGEFIICGCGKMGAQQSNPTERGTRYYGKNTSNDA